MKKRRIYLLLIILILTIEFIIIYFGNIAKEKTKIKADTFQTTGQIIGNESVDIVANNIENNIDSIELNNVEDIADINNNNEIISKEIIDFDIEDEVLIESENIIEEQKKEIIETNNLSSSYNDDTFIDGHLKEYPAFRRKIWNFNNR